MLRRISYGTRLLLSLGFILSVAFVSLSVFNYITIRTSLREEIASSSLPLTRENIYSEIHNDLAPPVQIASVMATDSFLMSWAEDGEKDVDRVTEYLKRIRTEFGYTTAFFVSSRSGNYYYAEGVLKHVSRDDSHDIWFYDFIDSETEFELDVDTNQALDDELTIFVNYRIHDHNGDTLGVTGVGITMKSFSAFLAEQQLRFDRRIYLVDREGIIQATSDPYRDNQTSMYDIEGLAEIAPSLLRVRDMPIDSSYRQNRSQVLVTARYMSEVDWFIIVEQNETGILSAPRRNLLRTLVIGFFTSLVILGASMFTVHRFQKRLRRLATTDELTGLANRREFEAGLSRCIYRLERYESPASIIIMDIDRFKGINDSAGHIIGDQVIQEISNVMTGTIRETDILARWGGDEFILLSECTSEQAVMSAERIRARVSEQGIAKRLNLQQRISLSCGVTQLIKGESIDDAMRRADEALYKSKRGGRDRVSSVLGGGPRS